jgi:hypothetical protein
VPTGLRVFAAGGVVMIALLAATACSSDTGHHTEAAQRSKAASDAVTKDPHDPIDFEEQGSGCATVPGEYLMWENIDVQRPIRLTGVELVDSVGVQLLDASVSTRPRGQVVSTGIVVGDRPPAADQKRIGWQDRRPVAGARLEPGTTYYLVLHLEYPERGGYDAIDVSWDDGRPGASRWQVPLEIGPDC